MKITAIKQQVKRSDRYSIFVDDSYCFSLSEAALLRSGITSGQKLDVATVEHYKQLSADDKLYARALRYVAVWARSVGELRQYLRRKDASESQAQEIIDRLMAVGLLDDTKFAASFVRDRQTLKPTSRRKLTLELKKKFISDENIVHALAEADFSDASSLNEMIIKKRRQSKYQDDEKLMQYLARQGYGYSDIKQALSHDD